MMQDTNSLKAIVIGAGFSGLSTATFLASRGYQVTVIEKHDSAGGRARVLKKDGFTFDMGPSWYWMPDVIERYFAAFDKSASDYFQLKRLDPSYQVIFSKENVFTVPASYPELRNEFEKKEAGAGNKLDEFLKEAGYKYEVGIKEFVYKSCLSWLEFADFKILKSAVKIDLLKSFAKHIRTFFKSEELLKIIEFPVLFLGAVPAKIPALYSMMNYADIKLGTWYPIGGFGSLVKAMHKLAQEQGVHFSFSTEVKKIEVDENKKGRVVTASGVQEADYIVASADYHHVEQQLLDKKYRNYSQEYWDKKTLAPSCLLYYVGVGKKLPKLQHHNLFFENEFEQHAHDIYTQPNWPENPLFYVCCPSKTDDSVAPENCENLFLLIPVAPGLEDTPQIRETYFNQLIKRLEDFCGEKFADQIISKTTYAYTDFVQDYNAFKGNAYGLANTLSQTAVLKPSIRNKKVKNLFFTGQLTVPGPGVPPAIISGEVVAKHILTLSERNESII